MSQLIRIYNGGGTRLRNHLSAADTTIDVASTSGFPSSGVLLLGGKYSGEIVTYADVEPMAFTGVTRGTNGTDARGLAIGDAVVELQWGTDAATVVADIEGEITDMANAARDAAIAASQPLDADLTAIAGLTTTTYGRSLLTQADATATRTTLGLGSLATQSGTFSGTSSGTNTGDQTSIVGITGTIAQFNTACTDADFATGGGTATGSNTGDQTITLTGNVTGTGTGSFAATIANSAVTYAKMQNVSATDKVLGRSSVGAGVVEEITCTAAGRALIDDADAAAQRTTLGLGTLATQSGTFSGTSSGTNTGDQTTVSGNAGTATALQTARAINGVSFDGTASIVAALYGRVTGSNATRTQQTLADIAGLSVALQANSVYDFECGMSVASSSTAGNGYGVQYSAAGATVEAQIKGTSTATATITKRISALNTSAQAFVAVAGDGGILIKGIVTTGANAGNLTIQHLKVTSGTATVYVNSYLRAIKIA